MKISRVIELLRCERECVFKNANGCDRNCDRCDLVQNDLELIEMYDFLISMMEIGQEVVEPIPPTDESDLWKCGNCNHQLFRCTHQRYCEMCGRSVKWK